MLVLSNITKRFGEITAVNDLSLRVEQGEVFGLLGPNGAGKTTTVSVSIGLLEPDSGSVEVAGLGSPREPAARARIGIAPQSLAVYEGLTVEENIRFFGRLYGFSGARLSERTRDCLDFVGLRERRKSMASTLSGGMKRRLNLAIALVNDPQLLLLDEPTLGVDAQSRSMILDRILDLKKQGKTIVYTTHYMEEAQRICDRVGIIDYGKLLALDTLSNLITRYGGQSTVVAETASGRIEIQTADPVGEIARICTDSKPDSLTLKNPDLEQVFLNLTGRHLRDN